MSDERIHAIHKRRTDGYLFHGGDLFYCECGWPGRGVAASRLQAVAHIDAVSRCEAAPSEREDERDAFYVSATTVCYFGPNLAARPLREGMLVVPESRALQAERERDEGEAEWKRAWKLRLEELTVERQRVEEAEQRHVERMAPVIEMLAEREHERDRLQEVLEAVIRNDQTPAFAYSEARESDGEEPPAGERWATPRELARAVRADMPNMQEVSSDRKAPQPEEER